MNSGVVISIFIFLIMILAVGAGFKMNTDYDIGYLKTKADYLEVFYHNLDKRWGDMYDIIKGQQEEIKELRRMIEPKDEKKPCCGNCRFYYELNNLDSACLNVHNNMQHKTDSTVYADGRSISWGTIKRVKPGDCCKYYRQREALDE